MSDKPEKLAAKHFAIDQPLTVTLADTGENAPYVSSGDGEYGPWYLYSVTLNGAKRSFFPSNALHQKIMEAWMEGGIGAGTELTICKHERSDGGEGIWWAVGVAGTASEPPGAMPQTAPPPPTPTQQGQREDKIGGINRMAHAALLAAGQQLGNAVGEFAVEDQRAWAATILIAYQKAGIGPSDFPDVQV